MRLFALVSKYYSFSPDVINEMTLYQFFGYLKEIAEVENIFHGVETPATDEEVLEEASMYGLKTPKGMT